VSTDPLDRRAHAPGTMVLHGMSIREQRRILRAWERSEARRPASGAPQAEDAPPVPSPPAPAEDPAPVEWLRLWEDGDPGAPPLPTPEEVRRRKRAERERRLLRRLMERHGDAVWELLAPRVRQLLADELGPALEVLLAQRERRR
jgi:hypothetical protein